MTTEKQREYIKKYREENRERIRIQKQGYYRKRKEKEQKEGWKKIIGITIYYADGTRIKLNNPLKKVLL